MGAADHIVDVIDDRLTDADRIAGQIPGEHLYLSGDFDSYWTFHIIRDQARLYPAGRWTVVVK